MTHIQIMQKGGNYWDKTIALAERCSWHAGATLAKKMRRNDFSDTERVVAAVIDDEVAGFCTFALTDELSAEYGFTRLGDYMTIYGTTDGLFVRPVK